MQNAPLFTLKKILYTLNPFVETPGRYIQVRPTDIFLKSYPKPGNTWVRFLFTHLVTDGIVDITIADDLLPDILDKSKAYIDAMSDPRLLKTHDSYCDVYPKVLYFVRDPRDVCDSYYFWMRKYKMLKRDTFDEFFEDYLTNGFEFGLWDEHVRSYKLAQERFPEKVRIFRYEDLKKNTRKVFEEMLEFVDLHPSEKEIERAIRGSEFNQMKKVEKERVPQKFIEQTDLSIPFVRSGKSEWRERLSSDQIERLESKFGETMIHFGYDLSTKS